MNAMKLHVSEPKIHYPYIKRKNLWQHLAIPVKNYSQENIYIVVIYALRHADSSRHNNLNFEFL